MKKIVIKLNKQNKYDIDTAYEYIKQVNEAFNVGKEQEINQIIDNTDDKKVKKNIAKKLLNKLKNKVKDISNIKQNVLKDFQVEAIIDTDKDTDFAYLYVFPAGMLNSPIGKNENIKFQMNYAFMKFWDKSIAKQQMKQILQNFSDEASAYLEEI